MTGKILFGRILREHIAPFFFSLFILTLIFLLNIVFRDLGRMLSRGISFWTFMEFLGLNMAWIMALAIPMAVLVSSLVTFGKMSADNEITAIKASGISVLQLLSPGLIAASILTFGLIYYNNTVLPEFNHQARLLTEDIYRKKPTIRIEPGLVYTEIPNINLLSKTIIEEGDSSRLESVIIDDLSFQDKRRTILAKQGVLKFDMIADRLFLDLYDGEIHEIDNTDFNEYRILRFQHHRMNIEIPGLSLKRSQSGSRGDREKSVEMMEKDITNHKKSILEREEKISLLIEQQLKEILDVSLMRQEVPTVSNGAGVPDFNVLNSKTANQIAHNKLKSFRNQISMETRLIQNYRKSINGLNVEIQKKYSIPVACIIFVLVGAPLGILTRKGNLGVAGGISILFFLLYWVFLIEGEVLADREIISPVVAMWAANLIVGSLALILVFISINDIRFNPFAFIGKRRVLQEPK